MLVFNNKAICFNSTAIDFAYYNWQDIHPSFIKSQTWNEGIDITSANENKGGLIIHLRSNFYDLLTAFNYNDSDNIGTWGYRYSDNVPLCYYSASNTPFVEPSQFMKPRFRKPEGLELCRGIMYHSNEATLTGGYSVYSRYPYSIKFSPSGNYGKNAGYYILDDSFLTRNNIDYVVEFTTAPAYSAGSGCAVWMGNLPYEYTNSAAYACFNMATYSSINNLNVKIDNTELPGIRTTLFAAGTDYSYPDNNKTVLNGLKNVKIEQRYTSGAIVLSPNSTVDYGYDGSLKYCNNVSSNAGVYCKSISSINNCTNVFTGNPV